MSKTYLVSGVTALLLLLAVAAPAAGQGISFEATVAGGHSVDMEAPDCPEGTSWRFSSSGVGTMADVGEVEYVLTQCTVFEPETGTATFGNGSITFTTADGDTLEVAQIGRSHIVPGPTPEDEPLGFTLGGSWQAVGGTGSFAVASGYGWFGGDGDIPGEMTLQLQGELVTGAPAE